MSKVIDVIVHTDGKVIWVNSGSRCEVRICGLDRLKGAKTSDAILSEDNGAMDITIRRQGGIKCHHFSGA